jgi:molybdopterin synthase catalytic subunit
MFIALRDTPLSIEEALAHVSHPGAGGLSFFVGVVRDENGGRRVSALEYQAYDAMAKSEMARIVSDLEREFVGVRLAALHRVGRLEVGETAVVCAAGAPHRAEAFAACRALIDRIKADVPIWKREWGPDGPLWVGWVDARCVGGDESEGAHSSHPHVHAPHVHAPHVHAPHVHAPHVHALHPSSAAQGQEPEGRTGGHEEG